MCVAHPKQSCWGAQAQLPSIIHTRTGMSYPNGSDPIPPLHAGQWGPLGQWATPSKRRSAAEEVCPPQAASASLPLCGCPCRKAAPYPAASKPQSGPQGFPILSSVCYPSKICDGHSKTHSRWEIKYPIVLSIHAETLSPSIAQ